MPRSARRSLVCSGLLLAVLAGSTAAATASSAAPASPAPASPAPAPAAVWKGLEARAAAKGTVPVVVVLAGAGVGPHGKGAAALSADATGAGRDRLLHDLGRTPRGLKAVPGAPFVALHADAADLAALRRSPAVAEVFEDRDLDLAGTSSNGSAAGAQLPAWWQRTQVGTDWTVANGYTGAGRRVVVIDTGVDRTHAWLAGRVVNEACFATNEDGTGACNNGARWQYDSTAAGVTGAASPCTYSYGCAHGTHVAHIAAGQYGAAPAAGIVAIRAAHPVWNANTRVWEPKFAWSDLTNALWYVYGPLPFVPAAVNMSIGGGPAYAGTCDGAGADLRLLGQYMTALKKDFGVATVVASGNDNYSTGLSAPACLADAVAVGNATRDTAGRIAVYGGVSDGSDSGANLDLLAPGTDICSAVPASLDGDGTADGISCSYVGTSMAAPAVAGALSVLKAARPALTVPGMVSALQRNGVAVTDSRNGLTRSVISISRAVYNG